MVEYASNNYMHIEFYSLLKFHKLKSGLNIKAALKIN